LQKIGEKVDVNQILPMAKRLYDKFKDHNFKQHCRQVKEQMKKDEEIENNP
jgi:hypothetical protein